MKDSALKLPFNWCNMIVDNEQLKPYISQQADLIPLHVWNKQTVRKGKIQLRGKTPLQGDWTTTNKNPDRALALAKKGHNVGYRLGEHDLVIDIDHRNFKAEIGRAHV